MEVSVIIGKCQHNTLGSVENAQESECCQRKDVFSCNANSINNTTVTEIKVPSCCNGCSEGGTINECGEEIYPWIIFGTRLCIFR